MRALRVDGSTTSLRAVPMPAAGDEVRVRVTHSGICNTDLELARGYMGFRGTIGHEFVGVVDELGADPTTLRVGQRVVGEINAGRGTRALCATGDSRHCATRTVLGIVARDGAHADYLTLPARNLIPVPDGVRALDAVFVEPLAAACGVVVEASGSAAGCARALDLLRPQGALVLKTTVHGTTAVDASRLVVDEVRVIGSRCGRFAPALELLARGAVDLAPLVSDVASLDRAERAMSQAATPGTLKVVLTR